MQPIFNLTEASKLCGRSIRAFLGIAEFSMYYGPVGWELVRSRSPMPQTHADYYTYVLVTVSSSTS
jgi:hypothetical protein